LSHYRFRNEEEHQAFLKFQHQTINELSGLFVSTLWDSIILQKSNEEEFVRDTITAIGALFSSEKRTIHDPTQERLTTFAPTPSLPIRTSAIWKSCENNEREINRTREQSQESADWLFARDMFRESPKELCASFNPFYQWTCFIARLA
jgi:hypothetical protein